MTAPQPSAFALVLEVWVAAAIDARAGRVPNEFTASFLAVNLAIAWTYGSAGPAMVWALLSIPVSLILHRLGLGGGDLKLVLSTAPLGGPIPWLSLALACAAGYLRGGRLSAADIAIFATVLTIPALL